MKKILIIIPVVLVMAITLFIHNQHQEQQKRNRLKNNYIYTLAILDSCIDRYQKSNLYAANKMLTAFNFVYGESLGNNIHIAYAEIRERRLKAEIFEEFCFDTAFNVNSKLPKGFISELTNR